MSLCHTNHGAHNRILERRVCLYNLSSLPPAHFAPALIACSHKRSSLSMECHRAKPTNALTFTCPHRKHFVCTPPNNGMRCIYCIWIWKSFAAWHSDACTYSAVGLGGSVLFSTGYQSNALKTGEFSTSVYEELAGCAVENRKQDPVTCPRPFTPFLVGWLRGKVGHCVLAVHELYSTTVDKVLSNAATLQNEWTMQLCQSVLSTSKSIAVSSRWIAQMRTVLKHHEQLQLYKLPAASLWPAMWTEWSLVVMVNLLLGLCSSHLTHFHLPRVVLFARSSAR